MIESIESPSENQPESESGAIEQRRENWFSKKILGAIESHPVLAQLVLMGSSGIALAEHLSKENRWSMENPTLPLTMAIILGSASVSRWLKNREENNKKHV